MSESALDRLVAIAAEHDLAVDVQYVPEGAARGWLVAIHGQTFGMGHDRNVEAAADRALATAGY